MAQDPNSPPIISNTNDNNNNQNNNNSNSKATNTSKNVNNSNKSITKSNPNDNSNNSNNSNNTDTNINETKESNPNSNSNDKQQQHIHTAFNNNFGPNKLISEPGGLGPNEIYIVPRSFKLLEELEFSEKGLINDSDLSLKYPNDINWINYGLEQFDDSLTYWNASIIPIQDTAIGDRIYQLKIITGESYPHDPPFMTFVQKVKLPFVDAHGTVAINKINEKFEWDREKTMLEILVSIRHEMGASANADKCARIGNGVTYGGFGGGYDSGNNGNEVDDDDHDDDDEDDYDDDEDDDY